MIPSTNELVDADCRRRKKSSVILESLLRRVLSGSLLACALWLALTIMVQDGNPDRRSSSVRIRQHRARSVGFVTDNLLCCRWRLAVRTTRTKTFRNWIWVEIGNFCASAGLVGNSSLAISLTMCTGRTAGHTGSG